MFWYSCVDFCREENKNIINIKKASFSQIFGKVFYRRSRILKAADTACCDMTNIGAEI
jgi:hypothetical protein